MLAFVAFLSVAGAAAGGGGGEGFESKTAGDEACGAASRRVGALFRHLTASSDAKTAATTGASGATAASGAAAPTEADAKPHIVVVMADGTG